jgi:hypothetical protein
VTAIERTGRSWKRYVGQLTPLDLIFITYIFQTNQLWWRPYTYGVTFISNSVSGKTSLSLDFGKRRIVHFKPSVSV